MINYYLTELKPIKHFQLLYDSFYITRNSVTRGETLFFHIKKESNKFNNKKEYTRTIYPKTDKKATYTHKIFFPPYMWIQVQF